MSLRQISTTTKISMMALEALERGDVARLPGGIFSRSFVRAYAREVGIDPERAVRDFVAAFPEQTIEGTSSHLSREPDVETFAESPRWYGSVLRAIGVVVPVVLVIVYFTAGQRLWPSSGAGRPQPPSTSAHSPATTSPESPLSQVPQAPAAGGPEPSPSQPYGTASGTPPAIAPSSALPPIDSTVLDSESRVVIRLAPSAICWVQFAVDGEAPEQQLMQAGDSREIRGRDEVVLTVGDAGALAYSINGLPGRSLGGPGSVVKAVRITADNFRTFVAKRP